MEKREVRRCRVRDTALPDAEAVHPSSWPGSSDTDLFGDMRLIAERYHPSLAFLPIGGHFTMDPAAAAHAVELLGVDAVAPMHYGTFPALAGTPEQLRSELANRRLGHVSVHETSPSGTLS